MRKKYFTEEEKKEARKLEARKYYDRFRKIPLSEEEKKLKKEESKVKRKAYAKEYYNKNREIIVEKCREYFKQNKIVKQFKNNKRYKERRDSSPEFKLITNLKRNIRAALKKNNFSKNNKTQSILCCSPIELKNYLESKFESWMNWDNYGKYNGTEGYGWDIDHIIPVSSGKTEDEIIKLNHFTNLQPLCSYINRVIKRSK